MDKVLFDSLYELVDLIKDSEEYKNLKLKEDIMLNDTMFISLSSIFKTYESSYNDAIKYHLDTTNITKDLSIAKEKLYNLDVVKDYLKALDIVNKLLKTTSEIISKGVIK